MPGFYPEPDIEGVREAVKRCFPSLAAKELTIAGRGWDFMAYRCSGYIVRVPRHEGAIARMPAESRLLAMLAPRLPVPIPVIELECDDGLDEKPICAYREVPGVPVDALEPATRHAAARDLGGFIRALHDVPVQLGIDAGLTGGDGRAARRRLEEEYSRVREEAFPLLTAEARVYGQTLFESFLEDDGNFDFRPAILHADIYEDHVLLEQDRLSGVLDFGDAFVGDPAIDFVWQFAQGRYDTFEAKLGSGALDAHLAGYGPDAIGYVERAHLYEEMRLFEDLLGSEVMQHEYLFEAIRRVEERAAAEG